jgi:hypothetical protein
MLMKPSPSLMLGIDDISFAWLALIRFSFPLRPSRNPRGAPLVYTTTDNTELHAEPGRFEIAIWRAERASPTRIFRCTMGVRAVNCRAPKVIWIWSPISNSIQKRFGVGGAVEAVPAVGRARLKIVLVTFGAISDFPALFLTNLSHRAPVYSTTFTTDLRVRSSSTANTRTHESVRSRVGQIVTARATRSAARRNLRHSPRTFARRTRVRAALTSCGQRARASPVSRRYLAVSHRYLTGISSFLSPSGRRCTAAGARSHSPCGP